MVLIETTLTVNTLKWSLENAVCMYRSEKAYSGSIWQYVNIYHAFFWFYFDPDRAYSAGRTDGTGASYCYVLSGKQTFNPICFFQILATYCGTVPCRPEQPGKCLVETVYKLLTYFCCEVFQLSLFRII